MQNMHYNMSYYMHYMPNNMQNMQNDNMQNNMQFNMHNMQAICRFGADCLVLTVICRICQIICPICRICWGDFQYAQYALPTLLMLTLSRKWHGPACQWVSDSTQAGEFDPTWQSRAVEADLLPSSLFSLTRRVAEVHSESTAERRRCGSQSGARVGIRPAVATQ